MESSLSLSYSELAAEVGQFLGYGRGEDEGDTAWTSRQQAAIDSAVKSGQRQFYYTPALPEYGILASYDWSFLKPTISVSLASGSRTVELPDDFGGVDGQISVTASSGTHPCPLDLVSEGRVRQAFAASPDQTGKPLLVSLQPAKGTGPRSGQRFSLYVFPEADAAYTLSFSYRILAHCLDGSRPYAYGGMAHAETVRAACLMAAEETLDDARGVWTQKFRERLAASIGHDMKNKPQALGYNGDRSDLQHHGRRRLWDNPPITYMGSEM